MIKMGEYNVMTVIKEKSPGVFLDDGGDGILLPKRFVPAGTQIGDDLKVFLYHDGEDRPIATTQKPYGIVGDIVKLKAISSNNQGAFLDWGLMKDLFVPKSKIKNYMVPNGEYLVKIYLDERTGRIAASEKLEAFLSNDDLTVNVLDEVDLLVYRQTDIGYEVIINNLHKGILHNNEIYRDISIGDKFRGFIKNILPENKIDVAAGKPGLDRVEDATEKVERLLKENDGYLPYHDKSTPEEIYSFFAMSKKTFKMATGNLYRQKKIVFTKTGIQSVE